MRNSLVKCPNFPRVFYIFELMRNDNLTSSVTLKESIISRFYKLDCEEIAAKYQFKF